MSQSCFIRSKWHDTTKRTPKKNTFVSLLIAYMTLKVKTRLQCGHVATGNLARATYATISVMILSIVGQGTKVFSFRVEEGPPQTFTCLIYNSDSEVDVATT